jgi:uncharacterized membrane protein YgcG
VSSDILWQVHPDRDLIKINHFPHNFNYSFPMFPYQIFRVHALIILLVSVLFSSQLALDSGNARAELNFPALTGPVVDQAGILDRASRAMLTQKLRAFEAKSTNQLVVVILTSLQDTSIENFGLRLFNYWHLGQKEKNNGVLLLVAPNEHKVRIEVGYGLEGTLTDWTAKNILDDTVIPRFRNGDFSDGIVRGVEAIIKLLEAETPVQNPSESKQSLPSNLASQAPPTQNSNLDATSQSPDQTVQRPRCDTFTTSKPYFVAECIAVGMDRAGHLDGLTEARATAKREYKSLSDCAPTSLSRLQQMATVGATKILSSGAISRLMDFSDAIRLECNKAADTSFNRATGP